MTKSIALVAHDQRKETLVAWAKKHEAILAKYSLFATGTTGSRLSAETNLKVTALKSGPLGGDAQIGAMIAEGKLAGLIFFTDPMSALPHDVDVKSLLRLATLYDIPLAVNESSATAIFGQENAF